VSFILRAAAFAAERHRNQRRKDEKASPYINHPLALADLLANEAQEGDPVVLASALLHDTVEDTGTTFGELEQSFGDRVTAIVRELTDDKSLPKTERKRLQIEHAAQLSRPAKLVKLADKVCNLRDISASPPADWSVERKRDYFEWAKTVVDGMRGTNARLETLFDKEYERRPMKYSADEMHKLYEGTPPKTQAEEVAFCRNLPARLDEFPDSTRRRPRRRSGRPRGRAFVWSFWRGSARRSGRRTAGCPTSWQRGS
jgi:GTP diphosphokinase / guanosine-3',5'-bis(diphosphate) 3'-diphosphatase